MLRAEVGVPEMPGVLPMVRERVLDIELGIQEAKESTSFR